MTSKKGAFSCPCTCAHWRTHIHDAIVQLLENYSWDTCMHKKSNVDVDSQYGIQQFPKLSTIKVLENIISWYMQFGYYAPCQLKLWTSETSGLSQP